MQSYKLSVVVPVYNTEKYLQETLLCIQNQSLGFENMQVLLINDGSTDCSSEICRNFQKSNNQNVQYIEYDKNQGVSCAKNAGLCMATGEYITFWDSDDLWSLNAMEKAVSFLEVHRTKIDMVSSNIVYFDGYEGQHVLNYNIVDNTMIDMQNDYQRIRTSGSASVLRTEVARKFQFDESQRYWEDAKYINQIMLQKKKYGMMEDVYYYYRRRRENNSATQSHYKDKGYYLHDLKAFFEGIYEESLRQCGEFIPMMQYLMAYTLGYFFSEEAEILNKEEHCQYNEIRKRILSHIDDCYLKKIPNVDILIKWKMLAFKYGLEIDDEINEWRQEEQKVQWNLMRNARNNTNYNVLKQWFTLKQHNKIIWTFFEKNQYHRIAIYGMSDLGKYLLEELAGSSIHVAYGIDQRAEKLAFEIPVLTIEDTLPDVDAIIVTAVYFFRELEEALGKKMICPVISLKDILDAIE